MDSIRKVRRSFVDRSKSKIPSANTVLVLVLLLVLLSGTALATVETFPAESKFNYYDDFDDGAAEGWILGGVSLTQKSYTSGGYSINHSWVDGSSEAAYSNPDLKGDGNTAVIQLRRYNAKWSTSFKQSSKVIGMNASTDKMRFVYRQNSDVGPDGLYMFDNANSEIFITSDYNLSTWMDMRIEYNGGRLKVWVWEAGTSAPSKPQYNSTTPSIPTSLESPDYVYFKDGQDRNGKYVDIAAWGESVPQYKVSGDVTDSSNEDLHNVTIEVENSTGSVIKTTSTNQLGDYNLSLENGTYNLTASKQGYRSQSETITVDGSEVTQDFQLTKFNQSIKLKTRSYLEHGQSRSYSVIVNVNGDRKEVTSNSTVTSGDTSVVTIDSGKEEVVATSNISINKRTFVRAEWNDSDGNTYTTERNVTVANQTVENIAVLPTFPRMAASLDDSTIQVIIVSTMIGAAAALLATSFAGISAMTIIMLLGWLAGFTNNGMAIVTVLMAMFVGMNVAGNVDYTVRR